MLSETKKGRKSDKKILTQLSHMKTLPELMEITGFSKGGLCYIVDKLESRGLIKKIIIKTGAQGRPKVYYRRKKI
jgi:DNA-binding PadR family transcriptional regulator